MKLLLSKTRSRTFAGDVSITRTGIYIRESFVDKAKLDDNCYASFGLDDDDQISLFIVHDMRPDFLKVTSNGKKSKSLAINISKGNRHMMSHYFGLYECEFRGENTQGILVYNLHRYRAEKKKSLFE